MRSDADFILRLVWQSSLVLAALALLIALGLAFKRWLEERAAAREAVRHGELSRLVQALLASPREPEEASVPPLRRGDEPVLLGIALDILRVTRGRDAERLLRLTTIWKLGPYLARLLAAPHRNRKIRALTLLSYFRDAESHDLLMAHIEDPATYVQLAALRGVAERGRVEDLPLAVKALSSARETNVPMLADILRRFGEPAVPALAGLAHGEAIPGVRHAAVTALGAIGSLEAVEPLQLLARDADPVLRRRALHALTRLGDPRAESAVVRGLVDEDDRVRAVAAQSAGLLGLREVIPSLADALNDEAWEVRFRAAGALYLLGAPGIAVLRAIADEDLRDAPAPPRDPEHPMADDSEPPVDPAAHMAAELLAEKEGLPA